MSDMLNKDKGKDKKMEHYTGGEKSGMVVEGPNEDLDGIVKKAGEGS